MTPTLLTVLGTIFVAAIGIAGSALSFYLTKRYEQKVKWQQEKLNHYRVLLSSFSDWMGDGTDKGEAKRRFALAVNTIALVAPQNVITALMAFVEEISMSHMVDQEKLKKLLLTIRKDIGLSTTDDPDSFYVRSVFSAPPDTDAE